VLVTTTDRPTVTHTPTAPTTATPAFGAGLADPAGLGLTAFAATTFFLSAVNAGWIKASAIGVVFGLALFYGGIAQLLAGMWEFAKGNSFGAVAFSTYGAFWLSFWYLQTHTDLSKATPKETEHAIGLYLLIWALITAYLMIAALRVNTVVLAVFVLLTLTFIALGIGEWTGKAPGVGLSKVGGYLGLITAIVAWYGSFAIVTNFTFKKVVLPVGPRA
jgi:succinate-acetate transporter protein